MNRSPVHSALRSGTHTQVWSSVSPLPWCSSKRSPPTVTSWRSAVGLVGVAVLGRPPEARHLELPLVDDAVVAGGQHVAVEAGGHRLVRDDPGREAGRRPPPPPRTAPCRRRGRCGRGCRRRCRAAGRSSPAPPRGWRRPGPGCRCRRARARRRWRSAATFPKLAMKPVPVGHLVEAAVAADGVDLPDASPRRSTACRSGRARWQPCRRLYEAERTGRSSQPTRRDLVTDHRLHGRPTGSTTDTVRRRCRRRRPTRPRPPGCGAARGGTSPARRGRRSRGRARMPRPVASSVCSWKA